MNKEPICESEVILNNISCVNARVGIRPLVRRESDDCGDDNDYRGDGYQESDDYDDDDNYNKCENLPNGDTII